MTDPASTTASSRETATLGGGCFWCTEAILSELAGVASVTSGYAGGTVPHPSYEQVCSGRTGHAEVVQVAFDPSVVSYHDLVTVFMTTHDPTSLNRQGNDVGTQYRSAIFYHSPAQRATAEQVVGELETAQLWKRKIVTEVVPFTEFYPAEEYHRDYFRRNPASGYCRAIIAPKVSKFRKQFAARLKTA
ncbi:MAG: peptide-methionine (S)-S-oxide reductase MsrA [Thermoplasmata archaeon]